MTANFNRSRGRLATDRYDFQNHIDGYSFRHTADQIDMNPILVVGSTTVQETLANLPGLSALAGDVTGAIGSNSVVKINGAIVPTVGSIGNTLQVTGSSSLSYAPINLGGGSNYIIGTLPVGNQATQVMGGDVSGTTASAIVAKIRGNTVAAQTLNSSTDGYILTWHNSAGQWQALPASSTSGSAGGDLLGTYPNPVVVNIQGNAIASGTLGSVQDGYALTWNNTASNWQAKPVINPTTTMGGDITGIFSAATVAKIQGISVSSSTPGVAQDGYALTWVNGSNQYQLKPTISSITPLAGDITGTIAATSVTKFQSIPLAFGTPGAAQDGYSISFKNSTNQWVLKPAPSGSFSASGDLSGSSSSQTVSGIDGYAIVSKPNPGQTLALTVSNQLVPIGFRDYVNVLAFRADNTGATPCDVQLQNAINAAGSTQTVYFPPGRYTISAPLWLTQGGQYLLGAGGTGITTGFGGSVNLRMGSYYGPLIIEEPLLRPGISTFPNITVVNGVSYLHMYGSTTPPANTSQNPFVNFLSNQVGSINGLTAMTFECNLIPHGDGFYRGFIAMSAGRRSDHDAASHNRAFELFSSSGVSGPYNLSVLITTANNANATFTVNNALPGDGNPHAIAASYDGYFARLYVDGYYQGKVAATGPIVQKWYESFLLGGSSDFGTAVYPDNIGASASFGWNSSIGNIRISKTARYTSEAAGQIYSPPLSSNLPFDSNTNLLMTFDSGKIQNSWVVGQTNGYGTSGNGGSNSPAWFKLNNLISVNSDGTGGNVVDNMFLQSWQDGIVMEVATFCNVQNCLILAARCIYGYNNCYYGTLSNLSIGNYIPAGSVANCWGIGYNGASGIHTIQEIAFDTGVNGWGFMFLNSSGNILKNVLINTTAGLGGYYVNDCNDHQLLNTGFGDEGGAGFTDYLCLFNNSQNITWMGGVVEITNPGTTSPAMIAIDGGSNFKFSIDFDAIGDHLLHIICPPSNAIEMQGSSQFVNLGATFYPQPSNLLNAQWFDGYSKVQFNLQELQNNTLNFASNGNMTVSNNDFLWGTLTLTDTSSVLTADGYHVYLPDIAGYTRVIRNKTAHSLNVGSKYTATVSVGSGLTITIISTLQPITGTVTPTAGGFAIVGAGTSFTTQLFVGEPIYLSGNSNPANQVNFPYLIASITDNTNCAVVNQMSQNSGSAGQSLLVPQWGIL